MSASGAVASVAFPPCPFQDKEEIGEDMEERRRFWGGQGGGKATLLGRTRRPFLLVLPKTRRKLGRTRRTGDAIGEDKEERRR